MLTPRRLVVFNLVIFLLGLTVLYSYASTSTTAAPPSRPYKPQPAAGAGEATHLSYISYTKNGGGETSTLTHPLSSDRRALQPAAAARPLVSQPEPTACEADSLHASPSGAYLIQPYNCHDNLIAQLIPTTAANPTPTSISRSDFLDWSPDGNWFLLRDVDQLEANQLLLMAADGSAKRCLTLPCSINGIYERIQMKTST